MAAAVRTDCRCITPYHNIRTAAELEPQDTVHGSVLCPLTTMSWRWPHRGTRSRLVIMYVTTADGCVAVGHQLLWVYAERDN
jgi:hypothetical protein